MVARTHGGITGRRSGQDTSLGEIWWLDVLVPQENEAAVAKILRHLVITGKEPAVDFSFNLFRFRCKHAHSRDEKRYLGELMCKLKVM